MNQKLPPGKLTPVQTHAQIEAHLHQINERFATLCRQMDAAQQNQKILAAKIDATWGNTLIGIVRGWLLDRKRKEAGK